MTVQQILDSEPRFRRLRNIVNRYGIAGAAAMLGVSAVDVEEAIAQGMPPSQWDQLVVGPQ
jgi:hypothetical protein